MDNINTNENSQNEILSPEIIKEVSETDKQIFENQLKGMIDLFSNLLTQNKKEYDSQMNEIKSLVSGVAEENKTMFNQQLSEIILSIPKLVEKTILSKEEEKRMILESNNDDRTTNKFSRVDALKEIIAGDNLNEIEALLELLEKEAQLVQEQILNEFSKFEKQMNQFIVENENNLVKRLHSIENDILNKMNAIRIVKTPRNSFANILLETALGTQKL